MIAPCGYPPDSCLVRAPCSARLPIQLHIWLPIWLPIRLLLSFLIQLFIRLRTRLQIGSARPTRATATPRHLALTELVVPKRNVLTFVWFDYLLFKQFGPRISIWLLVNIFACSSRMYCDTSIMWNQKSLWFWILYKGSWKSLLLRKLSFIHYWCRVSYSMALWLGSHCSGSWPNFFFVFSGVTLLWVHSSASFPQLLLVCDLCQAFWKCRKAESSKRHRHGKKKHRHSSEI